MAEVIGVIGAGTMGNGIAQVAARAGYNVVMHDVQEQFLERGMATLDKSLSRDVAKERLSVGEKQSIVARIATTTELEALREAVLIIEAITEDFAAKAAVFKSLDQITGPDTILASNTSSISITKLGAATKRPDKVIGT